MSSPRTFVFIGLNGLVCEETIAVFVSFIIKKIIAMFDSGDAFFIIKET